MDHTLNNPLIIDFTIEITSEYSGIEGTQVSKENNPMGVLDFCIDILK